MWTPAEFAANLNSVLHAYATSPVKTAANATILTRFWKDHDVAELPYQRGHLLAHLWDGQLRSKGGLDPVMLDMHRRAIDNQRANTQRYASELFVNAMLSAGIDIHPDLANFVDAGAPIVLPKDLLAPCGSIETRETPVFDWGFDIASTMEADQHVKHVDPQSRAYSSGLRDGMHILKREAGEMGDSEQEMVLRVDDAGTERRIRYMPAGKERVTLQRLVLDGMLNTTERDQCRKRLAGLL